MRAFSSCPRPSLRVHRSWPAWLCSGFLTAAFATALLVPQARAQTPNLSTDVGAVPAAGTSSFTTSTGTYQLTGTGTGVGGTADAFHFAYYQAVCGDGQMIVRLASADALAQAALVLRSSLDAGASSAAVAVSVTSVLSGMS